ncbi:uncharacterized protein Z519_08537 [Cladophialophora bantiana CBS 173.52]|uniref:ASTRA-associated protein 1 n=1 Tax=Cladophialophora bantiana (strain ATCC 10958 / CBS 173.52 / CDC B-1940 / NIH 8579) TaxID=1442370 RepID=A0A0D2I1H1_CLAB1|nr:uncharacterized protein Z519_08537 [Cladophialophora bantiana CBS 173.52]KIW90754.1 hypothetical protein Z519_08537 [Cladophialophora bantiana CBS 173.52]
MEPGPAVPAYILRGHEAAIHALHFYHNNALLASGDSDGWIVIWSLSSKRAVVAWKAHEEGIMQIKHWTRNRLVSHGRDHKLRIWQLRQEDLAGLSTRLPADSDGSASSPDQLQPWLLHSMSVNALNFCAFSMCDQDPQQPASEEASPQLIASPNGLDSGGIDIFQLPSERRVSQIKSDKGNPTGMVMAVCLFHKKTDSASRLVLIAGYEDGRVTVHAYQGDLSHPNGWSGAWQRVACSKAHTQPILSIATLPSKTHFLTSSADALISKFCLPFFLGDLQQEAKEEKPEELQTEKSINTKHAGQQGLSVRSDGKIFATAGWDGRVRVYSCKTMKELAVLKWHKGGCYSTIFADVDLIITHDVGGADGVPPSSSADPGGNLVLSKNTAPKDLSKPLNALDMIKRQREEKAQRTHWLAAGGKDCKISLWDLY